MWKRMQNNFESLSYDELIDLLAALTEKHTSTLAEHGLSSELESLRRSILLVQEEIIARDKKTDSV